MSRVAIPLARVRVPQPQGWPRPRLQAALDVAGPGRPAVVLAAAGSGKTTMLANWAHRQAGPVAWYRAEAGDAQLGLGACVARALAAVRPVIPLDPPTGDWTVERVVLAVEAFGSAVALVIDDVHELTDPGTAEQIEALLLLSPPNLTVVLSGRSGPRLNPARGELAAAVRISGDDLRFRSWEVEQLFREFHREPLRPDDAAALARRTDGWAAALQLFHLATHGRAPAHRSRAVRNLAAPARYAKDYLTAQVLDALPVRLQTLLTRTCVFDVVTAARCDALLGTSTAQSDLDELVARQALTTTDDGGATYRYHEVLRSYLEGVLHDQLGEAGAQEWYRRAAALAEAEGDLHGALRIRCRGGDWDGVRALLAGFGERLAAHDSAEWTQLLPDGLHGDDPWVMLAAARRLLDEGCFEQAARAARRAQGHFGRGGGADLCRQVGRIAAAWSGAPQLASPTWADMLRAATQRDPKQWAGRALEELPGPMAELVAGLALLVAGERQQAIELLERAAVSTSSPRVGLAARLALASAPLSVPGAGASRDLDAVAIEAEEQQAGWLAWLAGAMVQASTEAGLAGAEEAARRAAQDGNGWGALVLRLWLVSARARSAHLDLADLDRLIADCRVLGAGALEAWPRATRAMLLAQEGSPDADADAASAEAFARAAGVPGAQAIAFAALSVARGADSELRQLATSIGSAAGFDLALVLPDGGAVESGQAAAATALPAAAREPAAVEVTCFGPFRLRVGGVEQSLTRARPRARSLLRLLALQSEQPVHRERLTDLLWRDLDADAATHNLHVALSSLRRLLPETAAGAVVIERDGDAYRLVLGAHARSDLQEFTSLLQAAELAGVAGDDQARRGALQDALALYGGDLLPEEGAAEWVLEAREQYRLRAVDAAGGLAELELAAGVPALAVAAARRGLQVDRYDDRCWRALIAAHRAQGDVATALQAERDYAAVLDALGVPDAQHPPHALARNSSSPSGASGPLSGR